MTVVSETFVMFTNKKLQHLTQTFALNICILSNDTLTSLKLFFYSLERNFGGKTSLNKNSLRVKSSIFWHILLKYSSPFLVFKSLL